MQICQMDLLDFKGALQARRRRRSPHRSMVSASGSSNRGTLALRSRDFASAVAVLRKTLQAPGIHVATRLDSLINLSHALERVADCQG